MTPSRKPRQFDSKASEFPMADNAPKAASKPATKTSPAEFVNQVRAETRKVVWPTREETIQTTVTVLVFALIMGVFFWLLDMFLLYATRLLTGQGG